LTVLFILYINDLLHLIKNVTILFTGDTINTRIQEDLNKVIEWPVMAIKLQCIHGATLW
jgi:hypothetical protein